jgi:hypothetical protein
MLRVMFDRGVTVAVTGIVGKGKLARRGKDRASGLLSGTTRQLVVYLRSTTSIPHYN